LALDPQFATPWTLIAEAYDQQGDREAQEKSYDRCLQVVPTASSCLTHRLWVRVARGDCDGVGVDAETLVAAAPDDSRGYDFRTNALARRGAGADTLRAAAAQAADKVDPKRRETFRQLGAVRIALWIGDFAAAVEGAAAYERSIDLADVKPHSEAAWNLVQALVESGRLREAGVAADAFLKKSDLWVLGAMDAGVYGDWTPRLLDVARRSGVLTKEQWREQRDAWVTRWTKILPGKDDARAALVAAHVLPVETREDADDAVARLPELLPLTPEWTTNGDAILGKAYALAGRYDDAIPHLRRAANACLALEMPVDVTRASLLLGDALAAKGDPEGACAAYKVVVDRWGAARPRSITAEQAKRGMGKLGCRK
jgi:serine/threonine-protein kinase